MKRSGYQAALAVFAVLLTCAFLLAPAPRTEAADHADSPLVANDRAADLADSYLFVDPSDASKVVIAMTVQGFIVPGEAVNFVGFDPNIRYRFELETSGDAKPDKFVDIRFSARTSGSAPQTATITLPNNRIFMAPTTVATLAATPRPFTVTNDATSDVDFFAGEVDDPFFFDIPGFARFRDSILAGNPDPSQLERGRDTFAGYNTMAIALRLPISLIGPSGNTIGLNSVTQRQTKTKLLSTGETVGKGKKFLNVDRAGVPGVNALLVPFGRKNAYNAASTQDDAAGTFIPDIAGTLTALGTNSDNINILASVAIVSGDMLHLDTTIENSGPGGGNNAGAGFPNGRRLQDDVVDTLLFFVANQTPIGDGVPANDVSFTDTFPYFAPPQQPRNPGQDDNTQN